MKKYEGYLRGDLTTMVASTASLSGIEIDRQKQISSILERKAEQKKNDTWKLKFGGKEVPVKYLAEPVVGLIKYGTLFICR